MSKKRKLQNQQMRQATPPPGFSASKTHTIDAVTSGLAAIYGHETPDARKSLASIDPGRRRTWMAVIIALCAFVALLAATAWLGFWWWTGTQSDAGLEITVEGSSNVSLGQETAFTIHWENKSRDPVAAVELRVVFPNDFSISSIEPRPTSSANSGAAFTLRLGSQSAGAKGAIEVRGVFSGALGTESAIQVIATYRPATFNSDFEKLVTFPLTYTDSVLEGALTLPLHVLPGDTVELVYVITNNGDVPLEGLEARITFPDGFVRDVDDTSEPFEGRVARRSLPRIEAGASSSVSLVGAFAAGAHGEVTVHAEAGRVNSEGVFGAAEQTDGTLSVLAGDLALDVVVNGSGDARSVPLGERQRVAISYRNLSGVTLEDITLRLFLGHDPAAVQEANLPTLVRWDSLDDPQGSTREGDQLVLTPDAFPALALLAANTAGLLEFSVPIVSALPEGATGDTPLVVYAEATIGKVDGAEVNRTVKTEPIALRLQTDAFIHALARYTSEEGAPVGAGPLPPVVGSSTTYRVEWTVTKSLHALERLTVSATLPSSVAWGGAVEVSAGDVSYDSDRRLVTWTINRLPEDVGNALVSFNARLTPSQADVGRFASLLGETRMEFTDATLNEPLLRTAPSLSTDLPEDEFAKGKGVVRAP